MNKIELVDLKRQLLGDSVIGSKGIKEEIDRNIEKIVSNTSFTFGPFVEEFERNFAKFCGAKYCIGLNSGTDAIEFALRCNGITSGNVITAPNSYFTTASSITQTGATPKFVDINPKSYNIDVSKLEKAIDRDTKAILAVHMYGRPSEMNEIERISIKYNLKVIEDCAHAHGARYGERKVPILGTGAFSFFPGKNIGAWGDAGAIITNDKEIYKLARLWRNDGSEKKYHHEIIGRKARLDALQAAVLSAKLPYLDQWNSARRRHALSYNNLLSDIKNIQLPLLETSNITPVFHIYNILTKRRDELFSYLNERDISTGIHYPTSIHLQPAYKYLNLKEGSFPVAEEFSKRTLSLPMFPELRQDEIEHICKNIKDFFDKR